jgi:hypothetical protein
MMYVLFSPAAVSNLSASPAGVCTHVTDTLWTLSLLVSLSPRTTTLAFWPGHGLSSTAGAPATDFNRTGLLTPLFAV